LVYLAVPYSHTDSNVKELRFHAANKKGAELMKQGLMVFSPISHSHPMSIDAELPGDWEFWEQFDRAYLSCCHKLFVLMIDGWKTSTGVQAEIKIALEMGLPIEYIEL
jgi:hypothetical protein